MFGVIISFTAFAYGGSDMRLTLNGWDKDSLPANYSGKVAAKQPMLLVRVLEMNNRVAENIVNIEEWRSNKPKSNEGNVRRLVIPVDAIAPNFKVLLYPYHEGDELPTTNWNSKHTKVTVKWSNGQKQELDFSNNADGRTHLNIKSGETIFRL